MNQSARHVVLLAGPEGSTTHDYDFDLVKRVVLGIDRALTPDEDGKTYSQFWLCHVEGE